MASSIVYLGNLDDLVQFVVYETSNALNSYICSKGTPLIKKWVNYIPRKGVRLEIAEFFSFLFWFNSRSSLTTALTNMKLGREMKLCDPTNNVMFKQFISWKKQHQAIGHVRQRKPLWKTKLDM